MSHRNKRITITLLIILFIGVALLLYPGIANYINKKAQTSSMELYSEEVLELTEDENETLRADAEAYNSALAELNVPFVDFSNVPGYFDTLNVAGSGMMGYIVIDKIQVSLPIYHGTESDILAFACGHVQGSSLPCGGLGTHCVLSAHRGLPSAKLFTDLNKLEIGDTFRLTVLNEVLTYRVDQIKTVLPDEISDLAIEADMDYCTLVTCTPYGVNTHRLLVRGVRENEKTEKTVYVVSEADQIDRLIVVPVVALPMITALIIYVIFKPTKKKSNYEDKGVETL